MLFFLFCFSLSNSLSLSAKGKGFNTFYSQVSTISGDLFLKLLASGEIKYFMNIPMFQKDFDLISKTDFNYDVPFQTKPNNDLLSHLILLSPSILTFIFYRISEFFQTHKIVRIGSEEEIEYENSMNKENKSECAEISNNKPNILQSLELTNYNEYHINGKSEALTTQKSSYRTKYHTSNNWDYDEWERNEYESLIPNQISKDQELNNQLKGEFHNTRIKKCFSRADHLQSCFSSQERSSLLVNTKWF